MLGLGLGLGLPRSTLGLGLGALHLAAAARLRRHRTLQQLDRRVRLRMRWPVEQRLRLACEQLGPRRVARREAEAAVAALRGQLVTAELERAQRRIREAG